MKYSTGAQLCLARIITLRSIDHLDPHTHFGLIVRKTQQYFVLGGASSLWLLFFTTTGLYLVHIKMEKIKTTRSFKIRANNKNLPLIKSWLHEKLGESGTQYGRKWFSKTIEKMEVRVSVVPNQIITRRVLVPYKVFYFRDAANATLFALRWSNEKME